ncbi:MAG: hypothetical protein QNJ46_29260 [Leptolyngbyaceae cyanobacterium MO_188.B28]|nr:hypothetical protein [Leptolyngbyaceae cyanobacterium MO_188.B28]
MSTDHNLEDLPLMKIRSPADGGEDCCSQPIGLRRERRDAARENTPKDISVRRPPVSFLEDLLGDG